MTTARREIVDPDVTRYYHCTSRCVRDAFLCGPGFEHRKRWLEHRIEHLAKYFAVSVAGFAIMDNHFHVLVRLDCDDVGNWSDEEVVRRWMAIYPPKGIKWDDETNVQGWIERYRQNPKKVKDYREWLADLGWFMKCLKEPLSRMANEEDNKKGAFWASRYNSTAVLDEEGVLAVCAYIDLNPVAAGTAKTPETSNHTSIKQRVSHVCQKGKLDTLKSAQQGSITASRKIGNVEQDHWLIPFEDRRPHTNAKPASDREGMLEKFTVGNYLLLVEYTGRLFRQGKARISDEIREIFERLETSFEKWIDLVNRMLQAKSLRGRCFAGAEGGLNSIKPNRLTANAINLIPQMAED